jgi:transcriptional regulator with XRE-family HTH domain
VQQSEKKRAVFCGALADVIRQRRIELKLSLTQLGTRAGLSQQGVSYLEREMRVPNIGTLLMVADALDVDLSELIRRAESMIEIPVHKKAHSGLKS